RTGDIDIHAGDVMAGSDEKGDHAAADEACTAHYHDGHAFSPRCHAPFGLNEGATLLIDGGARKPSETESRTALPPCAHRHQVLPRNTRHRSRRKLAPYADGGATG